ncbi:MAG TPA: hypothetical protein VGM04_05635 [Sphingomicrobium sp.]
MMRRTFLKSAAAAGAALSISPLSAAATGMRTKWVVRGSEGFDALSFLSPLSGDPFYLDYYHDAVAQFAREMPAEAMATLRALKKQAEHAQILLSPFLDLRFSAASDETIDDLLASAAEPDSRILPRFRASPYWDASDTDDWPHFAAALPPLASVLTAMKTAGFAAFLRSSVEPKQSRMDELKGKLATFDPIAGAEFYTGRKFDPTIEIVLLEFCKPHGIKVIGQRFLSAIDWPDDVHIRTAGHEILHPPLAKTSLAWTTALKVLENDPLLARIVKEHDPKYGYSSLDGLFEEDLVSALDQLIAERFGVARKPGERWNEVDDGMHVLSAGLYGLMKQDGYARSGGNLEQWLLRQAKSGALAPAHLHSVAAGVLGRPADRLWLAPSPPST